VCVCVFLEKGLQEGFKEGVGWVFCAIPSLKIGNFKGDKILLKMT